MVKKASQASPNQLLRRARLERGWTQKEVADRIGAPLDLNVTRWERGTARPSAYYTQKLCALFGSSASELGLLPAPSEEETASLPDETAATAAPVQLWNVPLLRNPFFTGRDELLQTLHRLLRDQQRAVLTQAYALTGLGGIGKTQTAVEYAYRYRGEYRAIFWARATSRETLIADLVALADLLELPQRNASNQLATIEATRHWLAGHAGWLLIIDSADDLPLIADLLPAGAQGHLLLTTRSQITGHIAESLAVEKLEQAEAILLLLRRAKLIPSSAESEDLPAHMREQARAIVQSLDCLPLALDQAGAYIEEVGCSLEEYLALFQQRRSLLLQRKSSFAITYPYTVASTWSLSFQQIAAANPAAADLLCLLAFLDPDQIDEAMLRAGASAAGPVLEPVLLDPFRLHEVLQELRRYSLVKRDPERQSLRLHSLVQVVLKDAMSQEIRQQWAERTIRVLSAAFPDETFSVWDRCAACLPHLASASSLIDDYHFTFAQATRLLQQAGCYLRARGLYGEGKALFEQALRLCQQELGDEHETSASVRNDLGELCYYQGNYAEALIHFQRALAIREQMLGASHPDTATSLNNLAVVYRYQGNYEQAIPLYEQALALREQILEPTHRDIAESCNNLALAYRAQGRYAEAEPLYQRALAIRRQALGPEHPSTAQSLDNLAVLYYYQGNYEQAEQLQQRALRIFEQALGKTHPDTAMVLCNLARLYQARQEYARAQSCYERALAIFEQSLGPEHPRVARLLLNLAQFQLLQAHDEQADLLFQRALDLHQRILGPDHPDTIQARDSYSHFQSRLSTER